MLICTGFILHSVFLHKSVGCYGFFVLLCKVKVLLRKQRRFILIKTEVKNISWFIRKFFVLGQQNMWTMTAVMSKVKIRSVFDDSELLNWQKSGNKIHSSLHCSWHIITTSISGLFFYFLEITVELVEFRVTNLDGHLSCKVRNILHLKLLFTLHEIQPALDDNDVFFVIFFFVVMYEQ